jgi:hypothetical protein
LARFFKTFCKYCFGVENRGVAKGRAWHVVGYLRVRPDRSYLRDAGPSELASLSGGVVGGWSLLENYTVDASICGQVFKGARWMPWHQEPMKDVRGRDRPRGAAN